MSPLEGARRFARVDDVTDPPAESPGHSDEPGAAENADVSESVSQTDSGAPGRPAHGSDAEIDEAGDESFPASDAPQWWSGESDEDT